MLTDVELDELLDLARGDVDLNGVVDLHQGVGVADGASVVGGEEGNTLQANRELPNLAKLVLKDDQLVGY